LQRHLVEIGQGREFFSDVGAASMKLSGYFSAWTASSFVRTSFGERGIEVKLLVEQTANGDKELIGHTNWHSHPLDPGR
jgi:hypothetical protein